MPQSPLDDVVSHWHKLFANFRTSAEDFYTSVEAALDRWKLDGLKVSRVRSSEGGILSPDREYLRVTGERHCFDMCAAPFGTGYFFSSWVTERQARFVAFYLIFFAIVTLGIAWLLSKAMGMVTTALNGVWSGVLSGLLRPVFNPIVLLPIAFLIVLWLIAVAARAGEYGYEAAILTVPLIGWFYERFFAPKTYYRIDTMLMFQSAVHSAMMEAIDEQTNLKGVRGLTEDERKPLFGKLT
jgi:hypothetical protein